MPRNTRDSIKDKRRAIYNAVDRIFEHLYGMVNLTGGDHESVNTVTDAAAQLTHAYKEALTEILGKL